VGGAGNCREVTAQKNFPIRLKRERADRIVRGGIDGVGDCAIHSERGYGTGDRAKRIGHDCLPDAAGIGDWDIGKRERCIGRGRKVRAIFQPTKGERRSAGRRHDELSRLAGVDELIGRMAGDPRIVDGETGDRTGDRAIAVGNDDGVRGGIRAQNVAECEQRIA
jgi:hypothetical protein